MALSHWTPSSTFHLRPNGPQRRCVPARNSLAFKRRSAQRHTWSLHSQLVMSVRASQSDLRLHCDFAQTLAARHIAQRIRRGRAQQQGEGEFGHHEVIIAPPGIRHLMIRPVSRHLRRALSQQRLGLGTVHPRAPRQCFSRKPHLCDSSSAQRPTSG